MSSLLGVLRGFFPHRMLGWPGVGPLFVGRAVHSVGFCVAGAELASLEHLSSCNSNTWIGGCGSSHRAVGLTELDSYSISWDWCPGGSACEKKPNVLHSPPTPTPLTHRKGLSRAWPDRSNHGPSLCPLGLSSRPCKTLGMSYTGVHQVGWGLTTRVMA